MKKIYLLLMLLSVSIFAQKNVNNYKYVIVPNKFDFFKKADQYQTSSLIKFLFNKYGFTAFLSNEKLPTELTKNRCLALIANLKNNSSIFTTKNSIELKDCNNNIVYISKEGKSKIKEYKKAYHEAIRNSFKSIQKLGYQYKPNIKNFRKPQIPIEERAPDLLLPKSIDKKSVLYAQPIANGFQLVNTKPEVVFQLLKTSNPSIFIIKDKNGILYKNNTIWVAEFYEGKNKTIKHYSIKF